MKNLNTEHKDVDLHKYTWCLLKGFKVEFGLRGYCTHAHFTSLKVGEKAIECRSAGHNLVVIRLRFP